MAAVPERPRTASAERSGARVDSDGEERLCRALDLFLAQRRRSADGTPTGRGAVGRDAAGTEELIASHPELGELLEALAAPADALDADSEARRGVPAGGPPGALAPGRRLGDYRLIRPIGRGGMGEVWEAEERSLRRRVALKFLHSADRVAARSLARFRREAEAGARLAHPGLVAVYAVGEVDGLHFIAQELVEGGRTLADRIEAERGASRTERRFERTATLFAEVAEAVGAAHGAEVVHRDLKPENILLTRDGRPKVADFGLAWIQSDLSVSRDGDLTGTPYYMSPEQIRGTYKQGDGLDPRIDVFALGASLYEALTLRRPFDGPNRWAVCQKILDTEPEPPTRIDPRIPLDLAAIALRALEKDPARRYASVAELADDLRRFLEHRPVLARPPGWLGRLVRTVRRHPSRAALATALPALVVAAWAIRDVRLDAREDAHVRDELISQFVREKLANPFVLQPDAGFEAAASEARDTAERILAGRPDLQAAVLDSLIVAALGRARTRADRELAEAALDDLARLWAAERGEASERAVLPRLELARLARTDGDHARAAELRGAARAALPPGAPLAKLLAAEEALAAWCVRGRGDLPGLREAADALVELAGGSALSPPAARASLRAAGELRAALEDWAGAADAFARALAVGDDADGGGLEDFDLRALHASAIAELGEHQRARELLLDCRRDRTERFGEGSVGAHRDALVLARIDFLRGELLALPEAWEGALDALEEAGCGPGRQVLAGYRGLAQTYRQLARGRDRDYFNERAAQALRTEVSLRERTHEAGHPQLDAARAMLHVVEASLDAAGESDGTGEGRAVER